jgi:hypothetical protein
MERDGSDRRPRDICGSVTLTATVVAPKPETKRETGDGF